MSDQTPPPSQDPYAAPSAAPYSEQPQPYASAPGAPGAPAAKSPILSILSLVGGILGIIVGFFGWGLLFSIAGVVLGHLGRRREPNGRGMALAGLITGYVGIAVNVIVIGLAILFTVLALSSADYSSY